MVMPSISINSDDLAEHLYNMMVNKTFIFTDEDILSTLRYIKYEMFGGKNFKLIAILNDIWDDEVRIRFKRITPMILSDTYEKPKSSK